MNEEMDHILRIFFEECDEYLLDLEEGLNTISSGEYDQENINAIFRAVHSIKGGAASFGLDRLVHFAHVYESALDKLRANQISPTPEIVKTFLVAVDVLSDLISEAKKIISVVEEERIDESLRKLRLVTNVQGVPLKEEKEHNPLLNFKPVAVDLSKLKNIGQSAYSTLPKDNEDHLIEKRQNKNNFLYITLTPSEEDISNSEEVVNRIYRIRDFLPEDKKHLLKANCFFSEDEKNKKSFLTWEIKLPVCEEGGKESILDVFYDISKKYKIDIVEMSSQENNRLSSDAYSALEGKPLNDNEAELDTHITSNMISSHIQGKKDTHSTSSVRVNTEQISSLMKLVGEVAVCQASLERALKKCKTCVDQFVHSQIQIMRTHVKDIQNDLMSMRAQPVKKVFRRMRRVVREASALAGKDVHLVIEGEDTEVDRTLIDNLSDPLTHMLRNAVDHGIETPLERIKVGKKEKGTIWLSAFHNSGRILIKIRDDGAGINPQKVRAVALKRGIISEDHDLSLNEINELICTPGFSTASKVSDLSGRGVGMDVVRDAVHTLGGRVWIKSVEGEGTIFTLSLPLTLAVLDGMLIEYKRYVMVVPTTSVVGMAHEDTADIHFVGKDIISINGEHLPLIHLSDTLKLPEKCVSLALTPTAEQKMFLIVENEEGVRGALAVDQAYDQTQVVIKNISKNYSHLEGVSASTILADGSVSLILDVSSLISKATRGFDT